MYMQPGPKKTAILKAQKLRFQAIEIKEQRDNLIRQAHEHGATYEEIAGFLFISKSAIAKICQETSREEAAAMAERLEAKIAKLHKTQ